MWDSPNDQHAARQDERQILAPRQTLSHDRPCLECGHALHTFLPCSDSCGCRPQLLPGSWGRLSPA